MSCAQCGARLAPDDRFCGACGHDVTRDACPACRFVLPRGTRFCIRCGTRLETSAAAAEYGHGRPYRRDACVRFGVVATGCALAIGIALSAWYVASPVASSDPATYEPQTVSGTLGQTRADSGGFSVRRAFVRLYGSYDPNLDGAFWRARSAPQAFARWNGKQLFLRPLISREWTAAGARRHIVITHSLDVRKGDVVKQGMGCRSCPSLIGAALFERRGDDWTLISRHDFLAQGGSWGSPPRVSLSTSGSGRIEIELEEVSDGAVVRKNRIVLVERRDVQARLARIGDPQQR